MSYFYILVSSERGPIHVAHRRSISSKMYTNALSTIRGAMVRIALLVSGHVMTLSQIVCLLGAGLHLFFAVGEIIPRSEGAPQILAGVLEKQGMKVSDVKPLKLVVAIVQNAGAYNLIVAAGFLLAAFSIGLRGRPVPEMTAPLRAFFFAAAIFAGLMGLSISTLTWSQVAVGVLGLGALALEGAFSAPRVETSC